MCQELVQGAVTWIRENPKRHVVEFHLTSNETTITPDPNRVSYATGILSSYDSGSAFWGTIDNAVHYGWERIWGRGQQWFNDRFVKGSGTQNFDMSQPDHVELYIRLSTPGPNRESHHLSVELNMLSWGGGMIQLDGYRCERGVLFAHADGSPDRNGKNKVGYTITFKSVTIP